MALSKHLDPNCVAIIEQSLDREGVLQKISELAIASGKLGTLKQEQLFQKLLAREEQGSTAFGDGIAVPHCNEEGLENFVVGLLILKGKGTDFNAPDRKRVDLCFFIVGPSEARNEHIQILSSITRLLRTTEAAKELRRARWADDAYSVLVGSNEFGREAQEQTPASMMTVAVQDEADFIDILELFTAEPGSHIAVIEGNSAGRYLHNLPLFSSFWTDEQSTSVKIITAVLKSSACNNMIRRINAIRDTSRPDAGILISIAELSYWCGSLAY